MKHKLSRFIFTITLCISFCAQKISAQHFYPDGVVPGISAGYIFGAGISLGAELNYTPFVFSSGMGKTAAGLYASLNYFYSKGEIYKEDRKSVRVGKECRS